MSDGLAADRRALEPATARRRASIAVVACAAGLGAVEWLAAFGPPVAAAAVDATALVLLLGIWIAGGERAMAALALVPLLRLADMALAGSDPAATLVAGGLPALLAVCLAAHRLELPGILRLWEIRRRSQWHVALGALAASGVIDAALRVGPIAPVDSVLTVLGLAAVVFVFAGVLEELLFRGLVQASMTPLLGPWAVLVADALFAATYAGAASGAYVAVMAGFGLAWGWWVRRTGSLAGAAVGHGSLAAGLLVIWPAVH
jgi:membrane protease YdiL (CAAX protease family)